MSLALWGLTGTGAWADGKIFAPPALPPVEIPEQQALIHFADGRETLVIETAFLGEGTNFAWVLPLPAPPEIRAVSPDFFEALRQSFRPRFVHTIGRYYLGILFFCLWSVLAWRALKDEESLLRDLPLCLVVALVAGWAAHSVAVGAVALVAAILVRALTRTEAGMAWVMLVGLVPALLLSFRSEIWATWAGIEYMGDQDITPPGAEVTVLAHQRVGAFDVTTLQSASPEALTAWLQTNGFALSAAAVPVVRQYVDRGWIFVAAKVHRPGAARAPTAVHPLAFEFPAPAPVYPVQLTGVDNSDCSIDLYVFGERRARARHFRTVRCDWVRHNVEKSPARRPGHSALRVSDNEVRTLIGSAPVGTKLTARLSPEQMTRDVEVRWRRPARTGAAMYSHAAAGTFALNVATPLLALGWLAVGACRGGWGVTETGIRRGRWAVLALGVLVGLAVYAWLPKIALTPVWSPG